MVSTINFEKQDQRTVRGIAGADDGDLATGRHGELARLEGEAGIHLGVLRVVALEALHLEQGFDVADEIDLVGDFFRSKGIVFRIAGGADAIALDESTSDEGNEKKHGGTTQHFAHGES